MIHFLRALLLCCVFAGQTQSGATEQTAGRVTRVFDGDSFLVRAAHGAVLEVRLFAIDAPEKDQPHADAARDALRGLIQDREVRLQVVDQDRYGRQVARVYVAGLDVNAELVRGGHAWVYRLRKSDRTPSPDDAALKVLLELEREARAARRGLWALAEAQRVPPWRWRREHPRHPPPSAPPIATTGDLSRTP